jgi:hypothetical protein
MVDTIQTRAKITGHDGLTIYVPRDLKVDSLNPIKPGDKISITVDGKKMIIEKVG